MGLWFYQLFVPSALSSGKSTLKYILLTRPHGSVRVTHESTSTLIQWRACELIMVP